MKQVIKGGIVVILAALGAAWIYSMSRNEPIHMPPKMASTEPTPPHPEPESAPERSKFPGIQRSAGSMGKVLNPRSTFELSQDIWEFSKSRLGSVNSGELYEAYEASRECRGLLKLAPSLQNYASGAPNEVASGPYSEDRQRSITSLVTRCSGFFKNGFQASKELSDRLLQEGKSTGGPEFSKASKIASDAAIVEHFGELTSPAARQENMVQLFPLAEHLLQDIIGDSVLDKNTRDQVTGTALMLAMCQVGRDCSSSSYTYLAQCAISAKCGESLWDGWDSQFSSANTQLVNQLTGKIVGTLNHRQ